MFIVCIAECKKQQQELLKDGTCVQVKNVHMNQILAGIIRVGTQKTRYITNIRRQKVLNTFSEEEEEGPLSAPSESCSV